MKSFSILTLGCKVNQYESEALAGSLVKRGFSQLEWASEADFYIINGCAVTAKAAAKTRQQTRSIKRMHPEAKVILIGCYSGADPSRAKEIADLVLDNNTKPYLADYLEAMLRLEICSLQIGEGNYAFYDGSSQHEHTRPLVKIQDGCNMYCAYCAIPQMRGPERSRHLDEIADEVNFLSERGYHELILTGIHLSRWGKDFEPQVGLDHLLTHLLSLPGIPRLRLSSVEPTDIDERMLKLFSRKDPHLCPHLHLPLQSGCDATLKRMGRRYLTADYEELVKKLRLINPLISISTDLIVGFPGETEEEFAQTFDFCQRMNFSRMHIFSYSSRPGTRASLMADQQLSSIKEERSKRLHAAAHQMAVNYASSLVGQKVKVLLEQQNEPGQASGYSEYYVECLIDGFDSIPSQGKIVELLVTSCQGEKIKGEIIG